MSVFRVRSMARARRRVVVVGAVGAALVAWGAAQGIVASASGSPARPVDRDLSSYVLFAFNTLSFKGGESAGRGVISGGDVGAGGIDSTPGNSSATMDICANHSVTMDPGTQVVADTMRITSLCSVYDVYANHLVGGSDVVPQNSGPNGFSLPLLNAMPTIPAFSCDAGNPFSLDTNGSTTLAPGTYGDVDLKDGSETLLQPGVYNMCNLHIGRNATVKTVPGVEIRVAGTFVLGNGSIFSDTCDVPVYVRADGATGANDVAVSFGKHSVIYGHFLTLLGHIDLGDDNDFYGQVVGQTITSDKNVNISGCGGPPPTTTSSSSTTATSIESSSSSSSSSTTVTTFEGESSTSTSTSTSTTATSTSTSSTATTATTFEGESSTTTTIPVTVTTQGGASSTTTSVPSTVTTGGVPGSTSTTAAPGGASEEPLAFTGGNSSGLADFGLLAFMLGAGLIGYAWRRRSDG